MKLLIEVELGNDAMQSAADCTHSILASMTRQTAGRFDEPLTEGQEGLLRDYNGNTVGKWEVVES